MKGTRQHAGLTHVTATSGEAADALSMIFLMHYTLYNDQIGAISSNLIILIIHHSFVVRMFKILSQLF